MGYGTAIAWQPGRDKNISTHTLVLNRFVVFLYTVPYKKETSRRGKIVRS